MTDSQRPRTEAGRALLDDFDQYAMHDPTLDGSPRTYAFDEATLRMWIAGIEAEAATLAAPAGLREVAERLDAAIQAALPASSVAEPVWQERGDKWVPLPALLDLGRFLPCPVRSSLTDDPCVLPWGHPAASAERFHKFRAALEAAPRSPEPHVHEWEDAPDDETGWYCPGCGATEYPGMADELTPNVATGDPRNFTRAASPETPEAAPALDAAPPEGLDAAWARAEAALPEGWTLELGNWQAEPHRDPRLALYEATAGPYSFEEQERVGRCIGRGDTPAAALAELTGCLASREETP